MTLYLSLDPAGSEHSVRRRPGWDAGADKQGMDMYVWCGPACVQAAEAWDLRGENGTVLQGVPSICLVDA